MPYLSPALNVMTTAARKAARGLIRDFGELENLQVSMKGPADFVSTADKRTERILVEELTKARPGYNFLVEESGVIEGPDKSHRFIIDPLDGTTNFLHSIPHFAISIALEREGQLTSAVVFNPVTDEMFTAERSHGAYLNEKGLKVLAALDEVAAAHHAAVATIALAWLAAQPTVVAPIASARTTEQLPDLLQVSQMKLTEAELRKLSEASAPVGSNGSGS